MRVRLRSLRPEIPIWALPANPIQKRLEQRRVAQGLDAVVQPRQVRVAERRVHLLVARLAERRAMLGLAAFLPGLEMMLGDQARRDSALAEFARDPLIVVVPRMKIFAYAARHAGKS